MQPIRRRLAAGLVGALVACSSTHAFAQTPKYPAQGVKLVIAFAPSGPADIIGRIIGAKLAERWGVPVVIENRGGGGGNIAASAMTRAEPDGLTILVTTSAYAVNLSLYEKPGYAGGDYKVSSIVATTPNLIVAAPDLKASNLKDVIALSKTESLSFGTAGVGTTPHLSGEYIFRKLAKVDIRHVPFTGGGPSLNATAGGHVPLTVVAMPAAVELVKAGKVKGIAVTSAARMPELPDVPTVNESGLGNVVDSTWVAFFLPVKTPDAIVAKLNADITEVLKSADTKKAFSDTGFATVGGSPADAQKFVDAEIVKWAEVIRDIGVKITEAK